MKLTHIISGLSMGGAEMMLYKLLSVSDLGRDALNVISLTDVGPLGERIKKLGVPVKALGMARGRPSLTGLVRLSRWLRQSSPNVVQTWMYHADLIGGLAAKFGGRLPVVWGIRNSTLGRQSKKTTVLTVKACARISRWIPTKIVCCSSVARALHEQMGYNAGKMLVIPNGFDLSSFKPGDGARASLREELGLPHNAILIGFVARFDPQKDHQNFIQAARQLLAVLPGVHFVLCGDGINRDNHQLSAWLTEAGVKNRFHLLGRRDDVPRITAALDIATCTSAYGEAFPNVLGEAMACCVPCVATDVGDSALIIADTGRVVPPKDPQSLAGALNWMVELGADGRNHLGRKARQRIRENFELSVIRDRYHELYREVAANAVS
jgi:glycosyltransferase involved in cell wall biosynthesis